MTTQTTSDDEQMMYTNSGGPVPVFSGAMEDYASWRADVMDWEHSVKLPGPVKGSRLVLVQTDIIKKTMRSIGEEKVRSAEGFKLIMATMDATFTDDDDHLGLSSFEKWDGMSRFKNQSSANVAFNELKKHDSKVSMSDQLLTMKALARLQISAKDKTLIMSRMKDSINTHKLIRTIKSIYGKDAVPWMAPKSTQVNDIDDAALVNKEMFASENDNHEYSEDEAYWVKLKGSGKGKDFKNMKTGRIKCERCGLPGHPAKKCRIDWARIPQSVKAETESNELCGAFISVCQDCGHPDCEGPASDSDNSTRSYLSTHDFNF